MRGPAAFIRGIRRPEAFHGHGVRRGFFEGWYVKLVDPAQQARWALIPGVFPGRDGADITDEAFVQVLDGATGRSRSGPTTSHRMAYASTSPACAVMSSSCPHSIRGR